MIINCFKKLVATARGFTLIETLVAILLLSTAIAGPLTIAQEGLSSALLAKDQIGAFYLAQDAVEYLHYKRDSNCLAAGGSACSSSAWLGGLSSCISTDGSQACYVDSIQDTATACTSPTACPVLDYDNTPTDSTYHYFGYTFGTATPERYVRSVEILTPVGGSSSEAEAIVTVSWTGQGGLTHSVTVRENLFDWE